MAFLGLLVMLGAAAAGSARAEDFVGPTAPTEPAAQSVLDDPWSSPEIAAPRMEGGGRPLLRKREAARTATPADSAASRSIPWLRTTGSLAAVVGLIVLLAWGYRLASGRGRLALSGRRTNLIEVVGRTPLSPRQSLCLVRLGPRMVLLGLTHDGVRALDVICDADLTARLAGQAAERRPDSHTADFARCLEREAQVWDRPETGHRSEAGSQSGTGATRPGATDEAVTPEEARLVDVRQRLAQTVERLKAKLAQT